MSWLKEIQWTSDQALFGPCLDLVSNKPKIRRHEDNLNMDGTSDDIKELLTLLSVVTTWWLY